MNKSFIISDEKGRGLAVSYLNAVSLTKPLRIDIKPYKKNRSVSQNRLYRLWLNIIGNDIGYVDDELHEIFKSKFLTGGKVTEFKGHQFYIPVSTTKLNTKEFTEYLNKIELFATSELGIQLPHPDDLYWEAMGVKGY